jgi:hypothetical protein
MKHTRQNMDVIYTCCERKDRRELGVQQPIVVTSTIMCTALLIALTAAYLSFTSNQVIDEALAQLSPKGIAGTLVNAVKALLASFSGLSYLLYYFLFKASRIKHLR